MTLESELYLDQFLGFYPNGATIPPTKVDLTNPYSNKFFVRVMNIVSYSIRYTVLIHF